MSNAVCKVEKGVLTITVNLKERQGLSGSGNTVIIGSTGGALKIGEGDITVNLSVYTKEGLVEAQKKKAKENGFDSWGAYLKAQKGETA